MDPNNFIAFIAGLCGGLFIATGIVAVATRKRRVTGYQPPQFRSSVPMPACLPPRPPVGGTGKSVSWNQTISGDDVLRRAIKTYGAEAQTNVAVGELGELLTLIGRRAQGRDSEQQWIDEIADATIMLRQLALMHDAEIIEARISAKIARLQDRLDGTEKPESVIYKPVGFCGPYQPNEADRAH